MARRVDLTEYRAEWPGLYAEEAQRVLAVFGELAVTIHHVGSTSVPGLCAKPIIDMLLEVREIGRVDGLNAAMAALGYEARGENGIPGRRYFAKGGDARTHHLHVFAVGDPAGERHLAFREYLRAHPEAVQAYGDVKRQQAAVYPENVDAYQAGKHDFCQALEQQALAWWRGRQEIGSGAGN